MKPESLKCPDCGGRMVPRKSVFGAFWGCSKFPKCRGKRNVDGMSKEDIEATKSNGDDPDDFYAPGGPGWQDK